MRGREAILLVFAEDARIIDDDVEDAVAAPHQLGREAELFLDRGRQTGGLRQVVSTPAVVDGDLHEASIGTQRASAYPSAQQMPLAGCGAGADTQRAGRSASASSAMAGETAAASTPE